jgi:ADP-ribose pyrophosphatase YjhB (NUDIX family)
LRETTFLIGHLVARGFQLYWRWSRGLRLTAEACIIDDAGRVLLVQGSGRPDWRLPGGRVGKGETLEGALLRHLRETFAIEVTARPELVWIYVESGQGGKQHTGLFMVRSWRQRVNAAAAPALAFFPHQQLPNGLDPESAARIRQWLKDRAPPEVC